MIDAAHDDDLRSALEEHRKETEEQKDRLGQLAKDEGFKPNDANESHVNMTARE